METLKPNSQISGLESPAAVRSAAKEAGIDTKGKTIKQIGQEVIEAAAKIELPPTPPGYREVLFPLPRRPLAEAVALIAVNSLKQEKLTPSD